MFSQGGMEFHQIQSSLKLLNNESEVPFNEYVQADNSTILTLEKHKLASTMQERELTNN